MTPHPSLPSRSPLFWRRAALAPVCLLLVAALQVWRVHASDQSAWKGGGFGMFSTVDSPAARFVRVYITTNAGRIPVAPPAHLTKIVSELQAAPSQARIEELSVLLADEVFIDEQVTHQRLLKVAGVKEWIHDNRVTLIAASAAERAHSANDLIVPRSVEVELWQYRFDSSSQTVAATLHFSAEASAD